MSTKFKFCLESSKNKMARDLPKLKNISHLFCFVFADEVFLRDIEDGVLLQFGTSKKENEASQMEVVDMTSTLKVVLYIIQFLNIRIQKTKSFKFSIFSTKESATKLEELIESMIDDRLGLVKSAGIEKGELLTFLNILKVWSIGSEYENQTCEETVLHHFLLARNSKLASCLVKFGCVPNMKRFILRFDNETIAYMANHDFLNQELFEDQFPFHDISFGYACKPNQYYQLEVIFNSIISCLAPENLSRLFHLKSPKNKNLNAIEYACFNQADRILELFLNIDKCFKTTDDAINYDVSNLIPDTLVPNETNLNDNFPPLMMQPRIMFGELFQVSCLERIIASSEVNESKASKMLDIKPMTYLIDEYLLISKFVGFFMFFLQTIFMIVFTWFNVSCISHKFTALHNGTSASNASIYAHETGKDLDLPGALSILWIAWPLISFLFATYQIVAMSKMLSRCDIESSCLGKVCRLPLLDLMMLISLTVWTVVVVSLKLSQSYFQLTAVIFIVGWMRSALFISFCSHWHGFVVSLQSSLSKYFISFLFVFTFIYLGFSFALRLLLAEYASAEKPLYIVAFKTLAAVFGMGNLDEIPDEIEGPSRKKLFLKAVIISYCSLIAILVLAIIRQPDTELVVKVESELFPRLKLRLLKNVVWLMLWRRSRNIGKAGYTKFGSVMYHLHELFDIGGKTLKIVNGHYILRYYKEEIVNTEELWKNGNDINEMTLKEITKVRRLLEDLNRNLKICSS